MNNFGAVFGPRVERSDPASFLADEPLRRLRILREADADAKAISLALSDRANEQRQVKADADIRLRHLLHPAGGSGARPMDPSHPSVEVAQAQADAAAAELLRLIERQEAHALVRNGRGNLLMAVEQWLLSNAGQAFVSVERDLPKVLKGETFQAACDRLARRTREAAADIARIQVAPVPKAQAKKLARADIDSIAARGELDCGHLVEAGGSGRIRFPTKFINVVVPGPQHPVAVPVEMIDFEAIMAAACKPQLYALADAAVDAQGDDANALSDAERAKQLAQAEGDRLEAHRDLADMLFMALDAGTIIEPPVDLDPAAYLGVVVAPRAKPADVASSPEHAAMEVRGVARSSPRTSASPTRTPQMLNDGGYVVPPTQRGA